MNGLISQCVQEEERLKQERIPVVHVISQEHPKRKKMNKGNK